MAGWMQTKKRRRCWIAQAAAVTAIACFLPHVDATAWSDITTESMCTSGSCMAQGSTACDRASESCPPCIYAQSGGDYSCYSYDDDGNCPYEDALAVCSSDSSTSTPSSETATSESTVSSAENDDSSPINQSRTPSTSAPTATETAAPTTAPSTGSTNTTKSSETSASSDVGSSVNDSVSITTRPSGSSSISSSGSEGIYKSSDVTEPPTGSTETSESVDATNGSASDSEKSPLAVNVSVLAGVAVVAVLVAVFVVRRVQQNRKRRLKAQAHNLASPYSVDGDGGNGLFALTATNGMDKSAASSVVLLGDSQITSAAEVPTVYSMSSSLASSTAEFPHFDTGVGPLYLPSVSSARPGTSSRSAGDTTHFVDLSASSGSITTHASISSDDIVSARRLPQAIGEGEEYRYTQFDQQHELSPAVSELPVAPGLVLGAKPYRPPYYRHGDLDASGGPSVDTRGSATSSQADDYDIVDPSTLRAVEHRNTELVMRDGRFRQFSLVSDADIYDSDSEAGDSRRGRWPSFEEHML